MTRSRMLPSVLPEVGRRLLAPRQRELSDAGFEGERLVARARLVLSALILIVPLTVLVQGPQERENWIGLSFALITLALSVGVLAAVSRGFRPAWLGLATSLLDVTLVSCVLASFLLVGSPHMAVNSRTTFEIFFLAIGATCLRYDQRICIVTGLVAALQYAALVVFTATHWELNAPTFEPFFYGVFSWSGEVGRVVLMLGATVLSTTIVSRNERLRLLSTRDSLTFLYNRAYFLERLREELLRSARYGHPLSVAIIDVDHFKQVNDRWGHAAGDVVLRAFADRLRDQTRSTDLVARVGGEEFALAFPETPQDEARALLDRMREELRRVAIAVPRSAVPVRVSFSGGITAAPHEGTDASQLLALADARLLAAKHGGRDRVVAFDGLA